MRFNQLTTNLKAAVTAATVLLLGAGLVRAQQTVNLTAAPTSITMPDGTNVPMWGYTCSVTGTALTSGSQSCAATNTGAAGWSPVVITVPSGQDLTISLTNNLPITPGGSGIPTSLMIVGQLGGGLGSPTSSCGSTYSGTEIGRAHV